METTPHTKSIKGRDSIVQRHLLKFAQQGASQSGEPPQGAGIPSKPRDVEHSASQTAEPSGLTVQRTITGESAKVDTTVLKLPAAKPRLFGAVRRNYGQKGRCDNV
jgi:hypothetical protein